MGTLKGFMLEGRMGKKGDQEREENVKNKFYPLHHFLRAGPTSSTPTESGSDLTTRFATEIKSLQTEAFPQNSYSSLPTLCRDHMLVRRDSVWSPDGIDFPY